MGLPWAGVWKRPWSAIFAWPWLPPDSVCRKSFLGYYPVAGGTQRLPLVVGVEKAIQMIATGNQISAQDALQEGLIDEIIEGDLVSGAVAFAKKVLAEKRPLRKIRDRREKVDAVKGKPEVFAEARKAFAKSKRGFEAPQACIDAVEAAVNLPIEEGLKKEKGTFRKINDGFSVCGPAVCVLCRKGGGQDPGCAGRHTADTH